MTCMQALEQLLAVAPEDLAGTGDSPIATHVRACARCQAVATQLGVETRVLALALAGHRSRTAVLRRPRGIWFPAGALAAAAVGVVAAVLSREPAEHQSRSITTLAGAATSTVPTVTGSSDAHTRAATRRVRAREPLRPFPRATAVIATPILPVAVRARERSAVDAPAVVITPAPGQRAAILRSGRLDVTVVWLY